MFSGLNYLRLEEERQFGTCYRFLVTFFKEARKLLFYKIMTQCNSVSYY